MLLKAISRHHAMRFALQRRYCDKYLSENFSWVVSNGEFIKKPIKTNIVGNTKPIPTDVNATLSEILKNQKKILAEQEKIYELLDALDTRHTRHMAWHNCRSNF